jgi:hypothetical protein
MQDREPDRVVGAAVNECAERPTVESLEALLRPENGQQEMQASTASQKVQVPLPSDAAEVLRCLFFHGPTWDGNVPSKNGRDELVNMKLAQRGNGWQWLTRAGVEACFANKIHDEKERRESKQRGRRHRLESALREAIDSL